MRDAIDLLPTKVPGVELNLDAWFFWMGQLHGLDINLDAMRGRLVGVGFATCECLEESSLAYAAFAHQYKLGFVEFFALGRLFQAAQVGAKCVKPCPVGDFQSRVEKVVIQVEFSKFLQSRQ